MVSPAKLVSRIQQSEAIVRDVLGRPAARLRHRAPSIDDAALRAQHRRLTGGPKRSERIADHRLVRSTFRELREVLAGATAAELHPKLTELGFTAVAGAPPGTYTRDGVTVRTEPGTLGGRPYVHLEVRGGTRGFRGAMFEGALMPWRLWRELAEKNLEVLGEYVAAAEKSGRPFRPRDLDGLKRFLESGKKVGRVEKRRANRREINAAVHRLANVLRRLRDQGRAPSAALLYTEGPDAAGKSSIGSLVMRAFVLAGYDPKELAFKAPSPDELREHWIARYVRGIPRRGQVMRWDRGPAGSAVYGRVGPARTRKMAAEMMRLERSLLEQDVFVFKVEMHADRRKQARTLGKRLARAYIAKQMLDGLSADDRLDPITRDDLAKVTRLVGPADFRSLANYRRVQDGFRDFAKRTRTVVPWLVLDTTKRQDARLRMLAAVTRELGRRAIS
jgi:polyphosphate kinase 2 (PPK2 family)